MLPTRKFISFILYFIIFLFLIWQSVFWVGEYRQYKEYNDVMEKIDQGMSFYDWVKNYSFNNMLVVGDTMQFIKYQKYVAVQRSANKPHISWGEWKEDVEEYKKVAQDVFDSVEEKLSLEEADAYGGDTPEETWEMFLNALQEGDLELASKYFVTDKQAENLAWFQKVEDEGMLGDMIRDLTVSGLHPGPIGDTRAEYSVSGEDKISKAYIIMSKSLNNKWKLESI